MTLEEAKEIRTRNGLGCSTVEFVMALRTLEDHYAKLNKEKENEDGRNKETE